jgi:hypothetical protein
MVVAYEIHEWSLRLPAQTPDERLALKRNMAERVLKGLLPLEFPILLMGGKIVDGRHRYEIWRELAAEGACDGYFAKNDPWVEETKAEEGESKAALHLRLHSRNLCHRSLSADQRAAQLLLDIEDSPELKALVDQIEAENDARMKAGKARETDSQGSTNKQLGKMIGTSDATIKKAKAVQKHAPDKLKDVAQGKTTTNEVLSDVKAGKKSESVSKPKKEPAGPLLLLDANVGDSVLTILPYIMGSGDVKIQERIVKEVRGGEYFFEDGLMLTKDQAFVVTQAQKARKQELQRAIKMLEEELAKLRAALKQDGEILEPRKRGRGRPPKNPAA